MRVLILHNRYRQRGGEDVVVETESELLRRRGVEVRTEEVANDPESSGSLVTNIRTAAEGVWSRSSYRAVRAICREWRPDIAHVHNFWMKLSPSVHAACRAEGVPSVQSIHNYRLTCVNAFHLRGEVPCGDCLGKTPWLGVARKCYRGSAAASAAVAGMIAVSRWTGIWKRVDAFVTPSEVVRSNCREAGIPSSRIFVKPHSAPDPGLGAAPPSASDYLLFAGRLSREKGCRELIDAWSVAGVGQNMRLLFAGAGPDEDHLRRLAEFRGARNVEFLGFQNAESVRALMKGARAVVAPSLWEETFGLTLVEAQAAGRPVLASNRGAYSELVPSGQTGLLFDPGRQGEIVGALRAAHQDGRFMDRLGAAARDRYLREYTPDLNVSRLLDIYRRVLTGGMSETVAGEPRQDRVEAFSS